MRRINKYLYCLVAALPVIAIAGCSSGGGTGGAATGPPEVSSIVVDTVPTADAAGLYIALDDGFFTQQGLHVSLNPVFGGEYGMGDIQSGKAQLLEGNYVSFILAQIAKKFAPPDPNNPAKKLGAPKPINMRMIANSSQMQTGNQALYVMPGSPYTTVKRLASAHPKVSVGVNTLHNIGNVLLGSLLTANGFGLNSVKQDALPLPNMPKLLAENKVPAAWMPEPFGTIAQQAYGAIKIADFNQGSLENFPIGTIVGDTKWVQTHPNTIAAFLRAYNEGQQIADTNRTAVEQALVKHIQGMTPGIAATMTLDTYPLAMNVPVMQRVADAMFQFGVTPGLKKPYQIINMIQPEPGMVK